MVAGVAYAPAVWMYQFELPEASFETIAGPDRAREKQAFEQAVAGVAASLWDKSAQAEGEAADILAVEASLAEDPAFSKEVISGIKTGMPAERAVMAATEVFVKKFEAAGGMMAERASDLNDLRNRIIARLQGKAEVGLPDPDQPSVLLAKDISPTDATSLDPAKFKAIVTELGGPTSHTSILAKQSGIPCIVAAPGLTAIAEGEVVFVNATEGTVATQVDPAEAENLIDEEVRRQERVAGWLPPGRTADSRTVPLLANIKDLESAEAARAYRAQGVGLLRTEVNYLTTTSEPTVDEQIAWYDSIFKVFPAEKVVVRTIDSGTDKPVPFLTLRDEENPALGIRGLRTSFIEPGHLAHQLDAIAAAAKQNPDTDVWVMAPMVSTVDEARDFTAECHERGLRGGIMIEVPSAAVLAPAFMEVVDFVSVGTNDLTQYVMAADRQSPELAAYNDVWQPAVLNLVAHIAKAGNAAGKPVSVCGEAASDPLLACVLVGMGVNTLSMAAPQITQVGSALLGHSFAECQQAAEAACAVATPAAAREGARRVITARKPLY